MPTSPLFRSALTLILLCSALTGMAMTTSGAPSFPRFDFTRPEDVRGWEPTHDVSRLRRTAEGLEISISGGDPYINGPAQDYPEGTLLWLTVRVKSEQAGAAQIFWFRAGATEENSVRFQVPAGQWEATRLPLPELGRGYRLRFDPPGTSGKCVLAFLRSEERVVLKEPEWPRPVRPELTDRALTLRSGELELAHDGKSPNGFSLRVAGQEMAVGLTRSLIGAIHGGQPRWTPLGENAAVAARETAGSLLVTTTVRDADGATWRFEQRFSPGQPGAIDVETRVTVDQERRLLFLPMLVLLPGAGSFGTTKGQALLPGLEYLENEPSSSEADVVGPASKRQVPDNVKITFPLMSIQAQDRYLGLIWRKQPTFCALFDSPDRLFRSGGHLMGVLAPGSDGRNRAEGNLLPYDAELLPAGKPLTLSATLIGGQGKSVVPAVQQYVRLRGLPTVPDTGMTAAGYLELAARGWLDSKIRVGDRFRHAVWPGFREQPAADAAVFIEWLARRMNDAALATRLKETAQSAIARVGPDGYDTARVSHVFYPVASLVYGQVTGSTGRAEERGRALLDRFEPNGSVLYRRDPNRPDYGKAHFAPDANGLTAQVVASVLEAAAVTGDPELVREGVRVLRALDKFADGVPRGAQTWEVPLHTPDILASAHLVRAYTLGFEMTGDPQFLEQARYWAWTGVPFVYLVNPTGQPVGLYATIAVYGATSWAAPVWFGQPVQWCGLVYADALYRLAPHDADGPWGQIADGITATGIQQSWPPADTDRQGLLPDFYLLRSQTSDGPAINPGTVLANAIRLFRQPALYDFRSFRANGLLIHAPGSITGAKEEPGRITFTVNGWPDRPYRILIAGLKKTPRVLVNRREVTGATSRSYIEAEGRLILTVEGKATVEVQTR